MKEMVSQPVTSVERLQLMKGMVTLPVTHLAGDILSTCSTVYIYVETTWLLSSLCSQQDSQNLVSDVQLQELFLWRAGLACGSIVSCRYGKPVYYMQLQARCLLGREMHSSSETGHILK